VSRATDFELVSAVAHELRSPVAAVRNAAVALQVGERVEPATQQRLLSVISGAADQLARLVDDLLEAGRLGSRRVQIELQRCDAKQLAADSIEAARLAAAAPVEQKLVAPGSIEVVADPGRLRQILTNLLDNAVAHGGGSAVITIDPTGQGRVRIAVTDGGQGIPASERDRVFEPFHRLAGGSVRGTGLGLYLARELAQAMGGSLTAGEASGGGAELTLELPAAP
jgi:signal transduction histidine kinase